SSSTRAAGWCASSPVAPSTARTPRCCPRRSPTCSACRSPRLSRRRRRRSDRHLPRSPLPARAPPPQLHGGGARAGSFGGVSRLVRTEPLATIRPTLRPGQGGERTTMRTEREQDTPSLLQRLLGGVVGFAHRRPWLVLAIALALCGGSVYYSSTCLT